jgi:hypothetical protein
MNVFATWHDLTLRDDYSSGARIPGYVQELNNQHTIHTSRLTIPTLQNQQQINNIIMNKIGANIIIHKAQTWY